MRAAPRTDPDMRNYLIRLLPRVDAEALLPLVPASVRVTSLILSLCTGLVGLKRVPLGQVPSLHHLRQSMVTPCVIEEPLFDGFPGTMGLSDCSAAYTLGLRPKPSPVGLATDTPPATAELSRFPYMVLAHMLQVYGSGELKPALAISHRLHVAFPTVGQGRRSQGVISEINTAPVRPSANASPLHRWSSTHSLRPKRVASPYPAKDFHLLHHAGFCRRFPNVPHFSRSALLETIVTLSYLSAHSGGTSFRPSRHRSTMHCWNHCSLIFAWSVMITWNAGDNC